MDNFDIETKVKMLFATSAPVDSNFLNELKKRANVEIDRENRITEYIANDGNLKLKGDHSKRRIANSDLSKNADDHEDKSSTKKEAEKTTESIDSPSIIPSVNSPCSSDIKTPSIQSAEPSNEVIHNGPGKPSLPIPLMIKPKTLQYQTNSAHRDENINLRLDKVGNDFMNFIAEKSKSVENPLSAKDICKEFIEYSGSPRTIRCFEYRFFKDRRKIHELDNFDIETRVRMLFVTSTPVDSKFLNELKKQATVDVDHQDRITNYIANDRSLKLKGDHSRSSKNAFYLAERSKSGIHQKVSSNDVEEKEEEGEGELDVEDEDEDEERENLKDNVKKTITRSGRVSKRRFSSFDYYNDMDSDKQMSSTYKKIKKEDTKSIDSLTSINNNPSSSTRMTTSSQRTEPSKVVIYDDTGEPSLSIPFQLKEHLVADNVEFENTQMSDNSQHDKEIKMEIEDEEVVRDTHIMPVITSRINIKSTTASDEFLKPLHNVIKTLGSEMLAELERDVEKIMEKSRDENRKIPINYIELALRTALLMTTRAAKPKEVSSENAKTLIGFLMLLNIIAFNNSALTGVQQEIQETIKELGDEDKTVSIKNIRTVLETVLLLVTS